MSWQINAKMKLYCRKTFSVQTFSFCLFSFLLSTHMVSSWAGIYGMFALLILWASYGTDLLSAATWQRLKSPDCIWYDTHQHTIFVKTCGLHAFFSRSFPVFPSISAPPPPQPSPLLSLHPILCVGSPEDQKHKGDTKVMVTDRNIFINEIPQLDVCECRWKYKLEQMCLILPWNVIACSRDQHPPREKRRKANLEISVYLQRCCHATAELSLSPQTQKD